MIFDHRPGTIWKLRIIHLKGYIDGNARWATRSLPYPPHMGREAYDAGYSSGGQNADTRGSDAFFSSYRPLRR